MTTITPSENRSPLPLKYKVSESIKILTWGAIKLNFTHFFPASFQIKTSEKIIYIDPIEITTHEKADFIFITHFHPDHFSPKDIHNLVKDDTIIVCPKSVVKSLKKIRRDITIIKPNCSLDFGIFQCQAIPAYNKKPFFLWFKRHPKSLENVGYVFTFDDNVRIYHAGDTDLIPEIKKLENIRVALVPVGGNNLTMSFEDAAKMVNTIRPQTVIPYHYNQNNIDRFVEFEKMVHEGIEVIVLE